MAKRIKIGHASASEHGTTTGTAGDSTGNEVCIQENYNIVKNGFTVLIRPKTSYLADALAEICEAGCKNDKIGYSQSGELNRLSLYNEAKKDTIAFDLSKITTPCNTDCSAFMALCAIAAGCAVDPGLTTKTMAAQSTETKTFATSEDFHIYSDSIYFNSSDFLKRGDILVKPGSHTVMVLANGIKVPKTQLQFSTDTIIKLINNITNITETSIDALTHVSKISEGIEEPLTDKDTIKNYTWEVFINTYSPYENKVDKAAKTLVIDTAGTAAYSVNNLQPNTTYVLKTVATESATNIKYSSAYTIFTTSKSIESNSLIIDKKINKSSNEVDKLYINLSNGPMRSILYNNL